MRHSAACTHGDELSRHVFDKLVTRVGFLNVIREIQVTAERKNLIAELAEKFAPRRFALAA